MTTLVLSPRDGLFLKDGREWASSGGGRAYSLGWPAPSTLHGALCTARGRMIETGRGRPLAKEEWIALAAATTLDVMVALRRQVGSAATAWGLSHRMWPVAADALFTGKEGAAEPQVRRLQPRPGCVATLGRDDDPAREALWWPQVEDAGKPARPPEWWAEEAMLDWLADPRAIRKQDPRFTGFALPRHVQAHVGIDRTTGAARDEMLFAHEVVETLGDASNEAAAAPAGRREWAIGCRFTTNGAMPGRWITIGGDRRLAAAEVPGSDLFAFPESLKSAFATGRPTGVRLVAVTPAAFAAGWLPDGFVARDGAYYGMLPGIAGELVLRSALVPRSTHVSGWDMARAQPKPTTRLVPAGSVYHFARSGGAGFTADDGRALWLVQLGARGEHGFGRFLPGLWHPEEKTTC